MHPGSRNDDDDVLASCSLSPKSFASEVLGARFALEERGERSLGFAAGVLSRTLFHFLTARHDNLSDPRRRSRTFPKALNLRVYATVGVTSPLTQPLHARWPARGPGNWGNEKWRATVIDRRTRRILSLSKGDWRKLFLLEFGQRWISDGLGNWFGDYGGRDSLRYYLEQR